MLYQKPRSTGQWFVTLVSAFVIFTVVLLTGIFLIVRGTTMGSEPYGHAIMLVERNPEAMRTLGEGYRQKGLIFGSLLMNPVEKSGRADFSFKLAGQNGISKVEVYAVKNNNVWLYETVNFYPDAEGADMIDLLAD